MSSKKELRSYKSTHLELRAAPDGSRIISGNAVVYNSLSSDMRGWRERIAPGAFTKSLASNKELFILYGHDINQVLGRVSTGTATVTDTRTALTFTCKLGNTSFANDVADMLKRGDVSQCSFGFSNIAGTDTWTEENNVLIRTVTKATLFEISLVPLPAYPSSSVGLRSALATCPVELRKKFNLEDEDCDPDVDDDCDSGDEDRSELCECDCDGCTGGDCGDCTAEDCDDEQCAACPMQDEARADRMRIRSLFAHRMTV